MQEPCASLRMGTRPLPAGVVVVLKLSRSGESGFGRFYVERHSLRCPFWSLRRTEVLSDLTHSTCTLCSIDAVAETEVQGGEEGKKKT